MSIVTTRRRRKPHCAERRETRMYLLERDGWRCYHCRAPFERLSEATTDHYVPWSLWPVNLPANLVASCGPCNWGKSDRLPLTLAWLLLRTVDQAQYAPAA